ncbi:unnamed protein product [Didymodactylos carnosus]|uniref:Calx-beta domain-containing protein n=1 Tax=Didymodactylos carnosus TaxID=1234261 RepID=A0A8S2UTP7_9BILA|nr:unnamed protein product [Didymodactylos carnosus]CAF4349338.1 unnamed protein product [Didymodactylos carnosus]
MSLRKDNEDRKTRLGTKTVALVTIINDDEPGTLEFDEAVTFVKESAGKAVLKVIRSNGADGRISVRYQTKDIDAVGTKDYISKVTFF